MRRDTVECDTKSTHLKKSTKLKGNTNTKESADADESVNVGNCFLMRWSQSYEEWFKTPYLSKPGEADLARKMIESLKCKPRDVLAYAFRMWINTTDNDFVQQEGFDPLFYQVKGSRNLKFFLAHLQEIAEEQKEPLDCAIPVGEKDYRHLEEAIAKGRPD